MSNPFDDEAGVYVVLANDEGQHSLWPAFARIPGGWTVVHAEDTRVECLSFIEKNWTDMRPKSLVTEIDQAARRD